MKAEFVRILSHVQSFFLIAHFPYSRLGSFFLQIAFIFVFFYKKICLISDSLSFIGTFCVLPSNQTDAARKLLQQFDCCPVVFQPGERRLKNIYDRPVYLQFFNCCSRRFGQIALHGGNFLETEIKSSVAPGKR